MTGGCFVIARRPSGRRGNLMETCQALPPSSEATFFLGRMLADRLLRCVDPEGPEDMGDPEGVAVVRSQAAGSALGAGS